MTGQQLFESEDSEIGRGDRGRYRRWGLVTPELQTWWNDRAARKTEFGLTMLPIDEFPVHDFGMP